MNARSEAYERVVGTAPFVLNLDEPDMIHGKLVRSSIPHGRIRSIDTSAAEGRSGIAMILTGSMIASDSSVDPSFGLHRADQSILADQKVRYIGDPVALVLADTPDHARAAARSVRVEYDELPYVLDPEAAMRLDAPAVHEEWSDNDCGTWQLRHGDIARGWRDSDQIFDDVYRSPGASQVPMEPHVALARWDEGHLSVWTATQAPWVVQRILKGVFGLADRDLSVRTLNLGGGYGAKLIVRLEPLVSYAARLLGRPVRIELDRDEVFNTTAKHPAKVRIRTGVRNDGTLVARQVDIVWNAGAYGDSSPRGSGQGMVRAPGPYRIPHVWIDSRAIYTNTVPSGAFRGAMTSQVCWAYESQLDDIAASLGIDPVDLRLRNVLRAGDAYATGEVMKDVHFDEVLRDAATSIGWGEAMEPAPGTLRGKGVAIMIKSTYTPSRSEARLKVGTDGRVTILSNSVDMGQGTRQAFVRLIAEHLSMPEDALDIPYPDTSEAPFDTTTGSSRTMFSMGSALHVAADDLRSKLDDIAGEHWEVGLDDIHHGGGRVWVAGDPQSSKSYGELLQIAGLDELISWGEFETTGGLISLDPETGQGMATAHWHQAAAAVEVEVELDTGKIRVVHAHASAYAGSVVDPAGARLQNEGCIVFGLGPALFEELEFDDGQILNANLADYMIPSILDSPSLITSRALEGDGRSEVHGLGEMVVPAIAPAIGNALFRATGVRLRDLPLTAERVLRAMTEET